MSGKRTVTRKVAVESQTREEVFTERKRRGWVGDMEVTSQADSRLGEDAGGEGRTKDGAQLRGGLAGG